MKVIAPAVPASKVIEVAASQIGKAYRWGAEDDNIESPVAFDCSELVQWVCQRLKVEPPMVDGSGNQLSHCRKYGLGCTLESAQATAGALVFRRNKDTKKIEHVAFSDGLGNTIEARGSAYGVNRWPWRKGFTEAALIPGVKYQA